MLIALLLAGSLAGASPAGPQVASLPFTENRGQWAEHVEYAALWSTRDHRWVVRAERGALWVQAQERASGRGAVMRLAFEAGDDWAPTGIGERSERHHALIGNDPSKWVRDVRAWDQVEFRDGAGVVRASVVMRDGRLVVHDASGSLVPRMHLDGRDAFEAFVGARVIDRGGSELALVQAPDLGLVWSTYLGGALGHLEDLHDGAGHGGDLQRYAVCGYSNSPDFPQTPGAFNVHSPGIWNNASVACFDTRTGALLWSTLVGGLANDQARGIDMDVAGTVYVAGQTQSKDFPTSEGALQSTYEGVGLRGVALRLTAAGDDLVFGTYLGGAAAGNGSVATDVAARPDGAAVVAGYTSSATFVVTQGAYQVHKGESTDGFVSVLAPDGTGLEWSTYLGADGNDRVHAVTVEPDGAITVAGIGSGHFPTTPGALVFEKPSTQPGAGGLAMFITRLEPDGSALRWSAMIGSKSLNPPTLKLATGADGRVVIGGAASIGPLPPAPTSLQPTASGINNDGFLVVLSANGSTVLGATFMGGPPGDAVHAVHMDASGVVTTAGVGNLAPMWLTEPVLSPSFGPAFLVRLAPDLSRVLFGQVLGGATGFGTNAFTAVTLLSRGEVAASGDTLTKDFPTTEGAFQPDAPGNQSDGFVLRHRMLPQGVHQLGRSGPRCAPDAYLSVVGPATAGSASFAFYASNLPAHAPGVLAIGAPADPAQWLADSIPLHVRLDAPLVLLPWTSGPTGYAALDTPLPPAAAGLELAAQLFVVAPGLCPPHDIAWTHALRIGVGP